MHNIKMKEIVEICLTLQHEIKPDIDLVAALFFDRFCFAFV